MFYAYWWDMKHTQSSRVFVIWGLNMKIIISNHWLEKLTKGCSFFYTHTHTWNLKTSGLFSYNLRNYPYGWFTSNKQISWESVFDQESNLSSYSFTTILFLSILEIRVTIICEVALGGLVELVGIRKRWPFVELYVLL